METKIKNKTKNNNVIFNLIPDEYTGKEKEEILRVINEYNKICLDILNMKKEDK